MSDAKPRRSADKQTDASNTAAQVESSASSAKIGDAEPENEQLLKLQVALQRENQVFTSVSNVLKTKHDTAKNSIGNIK